MNLKFYSISSDFAQVDNLIKNLPNILPLSENHLKDIGLVLFEVLANILEHAICVYSKNQIFEGKLRVKEQKIYLIFYHQKNIFKIQIYYISNHKQKKLTSNFGNNGKKIIKYLCKSYFHQTIQNLNFESITFDLK